MRPEPVTQWGPDNQPKDPTVMALGDRIRELRNEHDWSQAELGQRISTDSQRISRYETGKITPSLDALIRLAEALDVSCDYLLIDGAPRRPLSTTDAAIAERLNQLATLDPNDRDAVLQILDGLITKNRVRDALTEAS